MSHSSFRNTAILIVYVKLGFIKIYNYISKEEGKNQEFIQSNTTVDLGHLIGSDKNTRKKHHIQESQEAREQVTTRLQETDKTV